MLFELRRGRRCATLAAVAGLPQVGACVSRSLDVIDSSGLPHQLTPMGTIIEGEWDQVMAVVTARFERMRAGCSRISTSVRIDYRAGTGGRLKSKVASGGQTLGRKLSK